MHRELPRSFSNNDANLDELAFARETCKQSFYICQVLPAHNTLCSCVIQEGLSFHVLWSLRPSTYRLWTFYHLPGPSSFVYSAASNIMKLSRQLIPLHGRMLLISLNPLLGGHRQKEPPTYIPSNAILTVKSTSRRISNPHPPSLTSVLKFVPVFSFRLRPEIANCPLI